MNPAFFKHICIIFILMLARKHTNTHTHPLIPCTTLDNFLNCVHQWLKISTEARLIGFVEARDNGCLWN